MGEKAARGLSRTVALFLVAELAFSLTEAFSGLYIAVGEEAAVAAWLTSGPGAPFFWIEVACSVAGIALLLQKSQTLHVAGAALAFASIFLVKYNICLLYTSRCV